MKRSLLSLSILILSFSSLFSQIAMTSWVSNTVNETQARLRVQYVAINDGYALVEVDFSMSAARCALSNLVTITIYENDGTGTYGTERYSTSFNPGNGSVPISHSEETRILINSSGLWEDLYVRVEVAGTNRPDDFDFSTPDCRTTIVANDTFDPCTNIATAANPALGTLHEGLIINNNQDFYQVSFSETFRRLQVSMKYPNDYRTSVSNLDLDLFVINASEEVVASSTSSAISTSAQIEEVIDEVLPAGTYYIRVEPKSGITSRNFYDLEASTSVIPAYTISGYVRYEDSSPYEGAEMNGLPGTITSNAEGYYTAVVPQGWSGTVTPLQYDVHFSPISQTYSSVNANFSAQDYTAIINTYTIAGTIRIVEGTGLSREGIEMLGFPESVYTDELGNYTATVEYGWSGRVTPVKTGMLFNPSSMDNPFITANRSDQDYLATIIMHRIYGQVRLSGTATGLNNVLFSGIVPMPYTYGNGDFSFEVAHGTAFEAIPTLFGYSFDPISISQSNVTHATYYPIIATLNTYTLDGHVRDEGGTGIEGVNMSGLPGNPTTLADGSYTVEVDHRWTGTVTPTLEGYAFNPSSHTYDYVYAPETRDFIATLNTYIISGTITVSGGGALSGVTMNGLPGNPVTDGSGNYSATVDHGWSGTVTPTFTGYSFAPTSSDYTSVISNQSQDYTAIIETYQIEGYITDAGGSGLGGVSVSGLPGDPTTHADGFYDVNVPHGWSGTVTPTLTGYTFDPVSMVYSNVTSVQSQNYTATINIYQIDGYVRTGGGTGIAGVMMLGLPTNPSTNAEGYYSGPVNYGRNITVTPTLDGYAFTPSSTDYIAVADNATTDYVGIPGPYLNTSQHIILFTSEAGVNDQVSVTSNVDWTVSCVEGWITCSPASGSDDGSFTISANSANTSTVDRNATVTVAGEGLSREIYVTQAGTDPFLEVSAATVSLGAAAASSQSLDISSNIAWTVSETADWLSVAPVSGTGNGSLVFTADLTNDAVDSRSTTVSVAGGGITRNIEVTQSGADPILEVSASTVSLGAAAASSQSLDITSNLDWTVSETADWLSVAPAAGSGDGSLVFTADLANDAVDSRSTTVSVAGGGITRNIEVTQAGNGAILEVSSTLVNISAAVGAGQTVAITSNIAWTASESSDWLSVSPESGSNDGVITISATTANEAIDSRSATVTVMGSGITHTIDVSQAGGDPSLGVSAPSENLASVAGSTLTLNVISNIAWTASLDAEWLSVSPASGSGDQILTISADSTNMAETERLATLSLEGGGMSRTVTITQDGTDYTGVHPFEELKLELYPNPSSDYIYLQSSMEVPEELSIKVLSSSGQVLSQMQQSRLIPGEPVQIDLSIYPTGQYLIHLSSDHIQKVYKVIKAK